MATRTVELKLTVTYTNEDDPNDVPNKQVCHDLLDNLVKLAANRGLLSGDTEYVIDSYSHKIESVHVSHPTQ